MINKDTQISVRNIIEKIVYISVIALFAFLWNINRKVDTITDNKSSIGKLWVKYGEMDDRIDAMNHEIGILKGRSIE